MDSPLPADERVTDGQLPPAQSEGEFNTLSFIIQQALAKLQTSTLVEVVGVTSAGELAPVGFVDVVPMVNQIDATGIPTEHVTIYNVPYVRIQGGANAIIIDPQVGDIGMCAFASRDISQVKANRAKGNPGSFRRYNFADGMYLGGLLNGTPNQYIQFNATGIKIYSPSKITLQAPVANVIAPVVSITAATSATITTGQLTVNGPTTINGPLAQSGGNATMSGSLTVTGDVTASGTSLHNHQHTSTTPGTPTSTPI